MIKNLDGVIGSKFNFLRIIRRDKVIYRANGRERQYWLCECDCGNFTRVRLDTLRDGGIKSCGKCPVIHEYEQLDNYIILKINHLDEIKNILIDNSSFELIKNYRIRVEKMENGNFYAYLYIPDSKQKDFRLHRVITSCPKTLISDHINGNTLDNRLSNLRFADNSQNGFNKKLMSNNTSGYRGVTWSKTMKKWYVSIQFYNKRINLGFFEDLEAAANAYRVASEKYHGDFGISNQTRNDM